MVIRPEWCPPGVWTTAVNAAGGEEFAYQAVAEGAAKLVMLERERCADIARNWPDRIEGRGITERIMDDAR